MKPNRSMTRPRSVPTGHAIIAQRFNLKNAPTACENSPKGIFCRRNEALSACANKLTKCEVIGARPKCDSVPKKPGLFTSRWRVWCIFEVETLGLAREEERVPKGRLKDRPKVAA